MNKEFLQKSISKLSFYFGIIILLLAFSSVGLIYYWKVTPSKILVINQLPVPVGEPENIRAGRIITLKFDYCKFTDTKGFVEPTLVSDRNVVILKPYDETLPAGCNKIDGPLVLPYTVITQTYHVHWKVTYYPNPVHTVIVEFDSEKFTLLPLVLDKSNLGGN